ncbi:MAG: TonB-dependent receptor [Bacteroidales bacterium]|nr:TonB-dependent receptor [Bacteroidales bacterium]
MKLAVTDHAADQKLKGRLIGSIFLIIMLFPFIVATGAEGKGYIKGRVSDSLTLEPLSYATVIYGRDRGTATDRDGFYFIAASPGNIKLTFKYVGYLSLTRSVNVIEGDTVFLDVRLEYDVADIDQVVISAGKVEQRVAELTVSMHIIKPELLSYSHIADAAELIKMTPGIEILDGQASIRGGSGFSYGAGSRVLTLIDGLPVLSADAGNIKWQFLPMENISQIEIIKGASSVLYGSSALNGIVNFRTAEAGSEPLTKFYVETGMFDSPRKEEWKWWDSPRIYASTSLSHLQKTGNTGLGMGIYMLNDRGYRKLNHERLGRMNLKIRHDNAVVKGLAYGINLTGGKTGKIDFVLWEDASQGALKQQEATANELIGSLFALDPWVSYEKGEKYSHTLRTRFQLSDNKFPEAGFNNSRAASFLAEYQSVYSVFTWLNINLGLSQNYSSIISEFYGDHKALNLAAYSQLDITPVDRLKLVGGLRIENNNLDGERDEIIPLFRAGINYRVADYTFLRASFGQGYRYPSIAEKHAATTLGSITIVPNPEILPESGWSTEIGVRHGLLKGSLNGQVDMALFYSRNINMIEYLFGIYQVPGGLGFRADNVEQSRVYGCEVEFSVTGSAGGFQNSFTGGYTFIYPVEFDPLTGRNKDTFLKYRRKHSLKLNLNSTYRNYDFGFLFHAASRMLNIDKIFLDEEINILPGFADYWSESNRGYFVVDPHLGYTINQRFRLSLTVKNVFNTEYMGRPGDILPHRNFSLRFSGNLTKQ